MPDDSTRTVLLALGPGIGITLAKVDIDDGLRGTQIKKLVRGIESGLKHESDNVYRADIVPIGGPQAPS